MAERDKYTQLVKEVFGNAKGEQLLAEWQELYGLQPSFIVGSNFEEVAYREGERAFYLTIRSIMRTP